MDHTHFRVNLGENKRAIALSHDELTALAGGKGAGLMRMARARVRVPPAVILPVTWCRDFRAASPTEQDTLVERMTTIVMDIYSAHFEWQAARGRALMSVRSGAPVSMPGMMDTILNVGLTTSMYASGREYEGKDDRRLPDCRRRLIQMLGTTAYGIPSTVFTAMLDEAKASAGVKHDAELNADQLDALGTRYLAAFEAATGKPFPDTVREQVSVAIRAVLVSWDNERARAYRDVNGISHDMGTAVIVQKMIFGNTGPSSGTGVLFTRDPNTGENKWFGEFLTNAQGEDVVAGIRTPVSIDVFAKNPKFSAARSRLSDYVDTLHREYRDMLDIEFTIEAGSLYVLQVRPGKRTATAALKIAADLHRQQVITTPELFARITRDQWRMAGKPVVAPDFATPPTCVGIPAVPGVVTGIARLAADAAASAAKGEPVILVGHETTPDDYSAMVASAGILTKVGGATSHAAVVARDMNRPCVVGALDIDPDTLVGKTVTIDGTTGRVWVGVTVPVTNPAANPALQHIYKAVRDIEPYVVSTEVGDKHVIPLVDMLDEAALSAFVKAWAKRASGSQRLVLDARQPRSLRAAEDAAVWEFLSSGLPSVAPLAGVLAALASKCEGLTRKSVVLTDCPTVRDMALSRGFQLVQTADTLAGLLEPGEVRRPVPALVDKLGVDGMRRLYQIAFRAGLDLLPGSAVPLEYAVHRALEAQQG